MKIHYYFILLSLFYKINVLSFFLRPWLFHNLLRKSNHFKAPEISKMSGFFGMIGPNVHAEKLETLFDLFVGDGVIQGVFFNNSNEITFVRHIIKTHKYLAEKNGNTVDNMFMKMATYMMYMMGMFPYNNIGAANTAILPLSIGDKNITSAYALFERDSPYLLHINHNTFTVKTIKHMSIPPNINHISGHSKTVLSVDLQEPTIESIEYDILSKTVLFYKLSENLTTVFSKIPVKMEYYPITHDFLSTTKNVVIIDSPLIHDFKQLLIGKIPIIFDRKLPTFIHVLDKQKKNTTKYRFQDAFYMFHYADYRETNNLIEIYGSHYENIDFSELNIHGYYRKIVIDKITKEVVVVKNDELECYNLDFPVKDSKGRIVLRNIENRIMNGFVMVDGLRIVKKWLFRDLFFCGEHVIINVEGRDILMAYANEMANAVGPNAVANEMGPVPKNQSVGPTKSGRLVMIDIVTDKIQIIKIPTTLTLGFHSTFIHHN